MSGLFRENNKDQPEAIIIKHRTLMTYASGPAEGFDFAMFGSLNDDGTVEESYAMPMDLWIGMGMPKSITLMASPGNTLEEEL